MLSGCPHVLLEEGSNVGGVYCRFMRLHGIFTCLYFYFLFFYLRPPPLKLLVEVLHHFPPVISPHSDRIIYFPVLFPRLEQSLLEHLHLGVHKLLWHLLLLCVQTKNSAIG